MEATLVFQMAIPCPYGLIGGLSLLRQTDKPTIYYSPETR